MKVASVLIGTALLLIVGCHSSPSVSSNHVWAIVKISYNPATLEAAGGSCGTVFFVNETNFVTAHHVVSSDTALFTPNKGYPNVRVFLANAQGDTIDDFWIVSRAPEHDLAVGRIRDPHPHVLVCPFDNSVNRGDAVVNLGFPSDQRLPGAVLRVRGHKLIVEQIQMAPDLQSGKVEVIRPESLQANDVKLRNQVVIILDHSSRDGYSGGPLVSRRSGRVVGLMSHLVPSDLRSPAAAIPIADIQPHILASDRSRTGDHPQRTLSNP